MLFLLDDWLQNGGGCTGFKMDKLKKQKQWRYTLETYSVGVHGNTMGTLKMAELYIHPYVENVLEERTFFTPWTSNSEYHFY